MISNWKFLPYLVVIVAAALAVRWGFDAMAGKEFDVEGGLMVGLSVWVGVLLGDSWRNRGAKNG